MWEEVRESEVGLDYTAISLPTIGFDFIFSDIQTAHSWAFFHAIVFLQFKGFAFKQSFNLSPPSQYEPKQKIISRKYLLVLVVNN